MNFLRRLFDAPQPQKAQPDTTRQELSSCRKLLQEIRAEVYTASQTLVEQKEKIGSNNRNLEATAKKHEELRQQIDAKKSELAKLSSEIENKECWLSVLNTTILQKEPVRVKESKPVCKQREPRKMPRYRVRFTPEFIAGFCKKFAHTDRLNGDELARAGVCRITSTPVRDITRSLYEKSVTEGKFRYFYKDDVVEWMKSFNDSTCKEPR